MSKRRTNVVSLAERREAAQVKHDARASYQRWSATFDLWRRGLLRTSRERARRGDLTVALQYWRFLPQSLRTRLERAGWPDKPLHGRSVSEFLVWDRRSREVDAASHVFDQNIRRTLRSLRLAGHADEGSGQAAAAAAA